MPVAFVHPGAINTIPPDILNLQDQIKSSSEAID